MVCWLKELHKLLRSDASSLSLGHVIRKLIRQVIMHPEEEEGAIDSIRTWTYCDCYAM